MKKINIQNIVFIVVTAFTLALFPSCATKRYVINDQGCFEAKEVSYKEFCAKVNELKAAEQELKEAKTLSELTLGKTKKGVKNLETEISRLNGELEKLRAALKAKEVKPKKKAKVTKKKRLGTEVVQKEEPSLDELHRIYEQYRKAAEGGKKQ